MGKKRQREADSKAEAPLDKSVDKSVDRMDEGSSSDEASTGS